MTMLDKRFDGRIPLETYLTAYVDDRPIRGFTSNISESGLYLNTLMDRPHERLTPVGLELVLPGTQETLWIAAELRYDLFTDEPFTGHGIRFKVMADRHGRLLREYCYQMRRRMLRSQRLKSPTSIVSACRIIGSSSGSKAS